MKLKLICLGILATFGLSACGAGNYLNPFYQEPSNIAMGGSSNDHELDGSGKEGSARQAFEQMASYQRERAPQPYNPVVQPAVVRLMWVPDHLNSKGDLVPSHYYYVKVLSDRWAVKDAFELESQLGATTSSSSLPYVYGGNK